MPFGGPVVALRLLDADAGDDRAAELQEILETRLLGMTFSDHAEKLDQLELRLRNDDYRLLDHPAFVAGQKCEVTWGWPGRTAAPRRMVVKGIQDTGGEVVVRAHCTMSLLNKDKRARFLAGATDAEFVRLVAAEYGYTGTLLSVEDTAVRHDITQPRWWTDAQHLRVLAKRHGFQFYIDATGLHWHARPTGRAPVREFIYRTDPGVGDLLEPPRFEVNLAKAITRVRVVSLDPLRREIVEQTAGVDDEGHVSLGREDDLFAPDDPDTGLRGARVGGEDVLAGGLMTAEDALERATGRYRETAQGRYKCTLRTIGDPRLGAKCVIGLWGAIAQAMAGLYYVLEVRTEIAPGQYTQEIRCRKDAKLEVAAAGKRRPRQRTNEAVMDFTGGMETLLTGVVDPSGQVVPAWIWTDDGGTTGQTSPLTEEQWAHLTPAQQEQWRYDQGAVSLPDR